MDVRAPSSWALVKIYTNYGGQERNSKPDIPDMLLKLWQQALCGLSGLLWLFPAGEIWNVHTRGLLKDTSPLSKLGAVESKGHGITS
jgi:hypothetical protein